MDEQKKFQKMRRMNELTSRNILAVCCCIPSIMSTNSQKVFDAVTCALDIREIATVLHYDTLLIEKGDLQVNKPEIQATIIAWCDRFHTACERATTLGIAKHPLISKLTALGKKLIAKLQELGIPLEPPPKPTPPPGRMVVESNWRHIHKT